jgi:hypothetical protein
VSSVFSVVSFQGCLTVDIVQMQCKAEEKGMDPTT